MTVPVQQEDAREDRLEQLRVNVRGIRCPRELVPVQGLLQQSLDKLAVRRDEGSAERFASGGSLRKSASKPGNA